MALEEKFEQNREDLKQVQDVMIRTKTEISQQVTDVRQELNRNIANTLTNEGRMDQSITECKFWLDKYTNAYKHNDARLEEMHTTFSGRIETIFDQISRRPSNDDMKKNFDKLNDLLFIKFSQLEDMK